MWGALDHNLMILKAAFQSDAEGRLLSLLLSVSRTSPLLDVCECCVENKSIVENNTWAGYSK